MKLYVLVKAGLSRSHQAVQAGHAVACWCLRHGRREWNGTLVYLKVQDDLEAWLHRLGPEACGFREPYWDDQLTAVAWLGGPDELNDLPLL